MSSSPAPPHRRRRGEHLGAPLPLADHRERAVRAALEMVDLVNGFNREQVLRGQMEIRIGIGIACGPVVVGFMGTQQRVPYTSVGDTANLAAHLEAHTNAVGHPILIDENTRGGLGEGFRVESHGAVQFKTRSQTAQLKASGGGIYPDGRGHRKFSHAGAASPPPRLA